jgi:hypothetical protein
MKWIPLHERKKRDEEVIADIKRLEAVVDLLGDDQKYKWKFRKTGDTTFSIDNINFPICGRLYAKNIRLFTSTWGWKGVAIAASLPRSCTPEDLAKKINDEFLPKMREDLKEMNERIEKESKALQNTKTRLSQISAIDVRNSGIYQRGFNKKPHADGHFGADGETFSNLDFRGVSPEILLKIVAVLTKYKNLDIAEIKFRHLPAEIAADILEAIYPEKEEKELDKTSKVT